ncbi:hypothetical protein E4U24_006978 [Claviceps purpurea]|nr:hypothetical protein E4U24_006978 [Claviceps purpurea]
MCAIVPRLATFDGTRGARSAYHMRGYVECGIQRPDHHGQDEIGDEPVGGVGGNAFGALAPPLDWIKTASTMKRFGGLRCSKIESSVKATLIEYLGT